MAKLLFGTEGDDELLGGEENDTLEGLGGNDILRGDGGRDSLSGGDGDDDLYGGTGRDVLIGGEGDDYLDGGGGADTMRGGAGEDSYRIDNVGDVIIEVGNSWDHVDSSVSYVMAERVDSLDLIGDDDLDATGNGLDNFIRGNSGNNHLIGGAGHDQLFGSGGSDLIEGGNGQDNLIVFEGGNSVLLGGRGGDTYEIANSSASVYEAAGEGTDIVHFDVSRRFQDQVTLTLEGEIEYIFIGGTGNSNVVATDTDNYIRASGLNNVVNVDALGGDDFIETGLWTAGRIYGGDGDDVIWCDHDGDGNELYGGNGDDIIYVHGWADIVSGGAGRDDFLFDQQDRPTTIIDFSVADDFVSLQSLPYLANGIMGARYFHAGAGADAVAQTDDHHVIFDTATGALYYDYDGVGGYDQWHFATLNIVDGGTLSHLNFRENDFRETEG